ncbi:membrane protein insertase YidC [Halalkalibacterium halodurans]|uniref:membrane protein insertase YidC n=1 Tax=Halalkalibacterium halodurans TaxID=86665 RepID=UPI002E1D6742|nr:membrane protein insertase YidC [Halalkalibacterium halodurans]MED4164991.1 membrane protein insertase YidC [Halalkalibacterium halodurans]
MKRRLLLFAGILLLVALAGCSTTDPITSESEGIWNHFFVYPMSWLITTVANLLNGSYGLSIIIVTILIRLALLPLTLKQQKSMRAMQVIRPEMEAIQKKYKEKGSKDPKVQQEMQKELLGLYQKHGVNPMAGCLPLFIQLPILMAFYFAIMRTEEIRYHTFLWFDLGQPDYILPFVAGITTYFQFKMTMSHQQQMQKTNPSDSDNPVANMMQMQMKVMLYVMPVMIIIAGLSLPSALSLYWVIGNIFMIIQTYFIVVKAPPLEVEQTKQKSSKPNKA